MGKIIGIDLGTTNSCVAFMEGGEPVVIPNSEGARTTPSVVAVTENDERLVGQIAKRQAITNPDHTVIAVKRLIGRKFESDEVSKVRETSSYEVVGHENGDSWVNLRDKQLSPAEISGMILSRMKQTAEDYLGEEITEAVVTVPAYFNDSQRQATKDAGRISGLDVKRIINEPTAAALAYGLDRDEGGIIAVYDLGGGTFDISILELNDGVFEVRATNGDTYLGGEDFDQRIIHFLADGFKEEHDVDLRQDKMALQRLREAAEKGKHELSSSEDTDINLPFICADASGPKHLTYTLTRSKLEELTDDLIERTLGPCKTAVADAGIDLSELSDVLLVGGMTRMPRVQEKVMEYFERDTNKEINPDEVVAVGAAVQGSVLSGATKNVLLLDVTPLTLGVETAGGVATAMITKNTTIPSKKGTVFSTAVDNQPMVAVHVIQGERPMAEDNKTLARFELVGIPPAPRGVPQIEVSFDIDANGIVHVSAKDLGTGKQQSVRITSSSGLSEDEIQRMIAAAESSRDDDMAKKELADVRGNAEGLIYTTEKSLEEYGHVLEESDNADIALYLGELKAAIAKENIENIRTTISQLEVVSHKMAEAMYQEAYESMDDEDDLGLDDDDE
ncbi:MAG: molecular chaperone DnaK [Deltaproteobacteria bacterium]|nr:molecular chaperone DnaK [Deltaproteobacteria bacterium]